MTSRYLPRVPGMHTRVPGVGRQACIPVFIHGYAYLAKCMHTRYNCIWTVGFQSRAKSGILGYIVPRYNTKLNTNCVCICIRARRSEECQVVLVQFVHFFVHFNVRKEKIKEGLLLFSSDVGVQILFNIHFKIYTNSKTSLASLF